MFNYFTVTKNLHNLLRVYSPDQSRANPSKFYPGDAFVDVVSLDAYTDDPVRTNMPCSMSFIETILFSTP